MQIADLEDILAAPDGSATAWWDSCLDGLADKTVIFDDDPLGGQAVSSIPVYFSWDSGTIEKAFSSPSSAFFILTSSRSLPDDETERIYREASRNIARTARLTGKSVQLVCRSDSTLRMHFPLESEAIAAGAGMKLSGEVLFPFFEEGRRYTYHGEQYCLSGDELIRASNSEYAKDKTFGYRSSYLPEWVEEKSNGRIKASSVSVITIETIRSGWEAVAEVLRNGGLIVSDALCYQDLHVLMRALYEVSRSGLRFLLRCASSGVRASSFCHEEVNGLAQRIGRSLSGGRILIAAGSHMKRTTEQLSRLEENSDAVKIEFDQRSVVDKSKLSEEIEKTAESIRKAVEEGHDVILQTRRERFDIPGADAEEQLRLTKSISEAFISLIDTVKDLFQLFISKGGNTSSDIVRICFSPEYAVVEGQVMPGVPVWKLPGTERRIVIFPGNVGEADSLLNVYRSIRSADDHS